MSQENILGQDVAEVSNEKEKRSTKFTHSDKFPKQSYMGNASLVQCTA